MKRVTYGGKIFTEVISKHPLRATIQTVDGRIVGLVHLHPDHRLSDEMNLEDPFLAVTDACVVTQDGKSCVDFIAVNKAHVIWVIPVQDGETEDD